MQQNAKNILLEKSISSRKTHLQEVVCIPQKHGVPVLVNKKRRVLYVRKKEKGKKGEGVFLCQSWCLFYVVENKVCFLHGTRAPPTCRVVKIFNDIVWRMRWWLSHVICCYTFLFFCALQVPHNQQNLCSNLNIV